MPDYDLAIIGAGCAGLSLAARLADRAPALKIVLIDPRTGFEDDRTWCFWSDGSARLDHLAAARWPAWRFSSADQACVHAAPGLEYVMVRGADFYADALARLEGSNLALRLGARAARLDETPRSVRVILDDAAPVTARYAVDTRPDRTAAALMHQIFFGLEIETDHDAFDPCCAGLMDQLAGADGAVSFLYTLPLTRRRALVEWTVFARTPCAPDTLRPALETALNERGLAPARIVRTERGVLPMGAAAAEKTGPSRIVKAGAGGGAVRAATGYAFQRIQAWAEACADALDQGGPPVAHPQEPAMRAWMDQVFLKALSRNTAKGGDFFMALARHVPPAALARFMSDQAGPADLARVIAALPPGPFLAALAAPAHRSGCGALEERPA
jgi:lycopene beta-cyclase